MSNHGLFTACVLIWGSTWLAITYQLGEISPAYSVAFRYCIAVTILGGFCWYKRLAMHLPLSLHFKIVVVGVCMYALNYMLVYHSQKYIISAWAAVLSCCIIYLNVFFRKVLLKKPVRTEVLIGGFVGISGLVCLFWPELAGMELETAFMLGVVLSLLSSTAASLGNVVSESALNNGAPIIQLNFYAMLYGLPVSFGYAILAGDAFVIPTQISYWLSLLYLGVFGSVLAFGAYMKLVQNMGSDKSAYVVLMYPLVALLLSTLYEGYQWQFIGFVGVGLLLIGNMIAMGKIKLPRRQLTVELDTKKES